VCASYFCCCWCCCCCCCCCCFLLAARPCIGRCRYCYASPWQALFLCVFAIRFSHRLDPISQFPFVSI
jgi:hypothetical protein